VLDNLGAIKSKIEEERRSKEDDEILFDEESDTSLLSYNEAVVYYHLKQYATATTILEVLFSNVEPIEEGLAIRISFLLLDCYHVLESPEKGSKPLEFLEKLLTRIDAELSKETAKKSSQKGEDTDVSSFFQAASEKSTLACPETITLSGLRVGLHLYKAKFHLMNRSFRSSKRDIKLALSVESNNPQATVLKANLEYLKANYRKALKLLQTACVEVQEEDALRMGEGVEGGSKVPDMEPLVQNNIGLIHYSMQNYNASLWHLSRALKSAQGLAEARLLKASEGMAPPFYFDGVGQPSAGVCTFSRDRKSQILYNTGIQLLFTGKPVIALIASRRHRICTIHLRVCG